MEEQKILFYRKNKKRDRAQVDQKFQLMQYHCEIPQIVGYFERERDLKKYVKTNYPTYSLKRIREGRVTLKKTPVETVDHIYLLLDGEAIRDLTWGMSWQKVARLEQIEGDESHLKKNEQIQGFNVQVYFGFNDWANCGLEYISYSSTELAFYNEQLRELTNKYGKSEKIVDFRGLDRLLKKGHLKNERVLSLFLNNPNSPFFNRFIKNNSQLAYRSAQKWEVDQTVILLYKKLPASPGNRDKINHPYVVEYLPKQLFDFFEECFAQLFIHV